MLFHWLVKAIGQRAAHRQHQDGRVDEPGDVEAPAARHPQCHRDHRELRHHDGDAGPQQRRRIGHGGGQALVQQRQHGRVAQVKEGAGQREQQQRALPEQRQSRRRMRPRRGSVAPAWAAPLRHGPHLLAQRGRCRRIGLFAARGLMVDVRARIVSTDASAPTVIAPITASIQGAPNQCATSPAPMADSMLPGMAAGFVAARLVLEAGGARQPQRQRRHGAPRAPRRPARSRPATRSAAAPTAW